MFLVLLNVPEAVCVHACAFKAVPKRGGSESAMFKCCG